MGSVGDLSPGGSIAIGILVGLLSTGVQSIGLTLQRKSHILEDEKGPHDVRRPPHRRRRWQLGMGMFIVANVLGSSIQISMLPLPVLSTLQASGLVFNSICASLILGEPFTRWSLGGTLLVCCGAVLIAVFGAIPSPAHKLNELLDLMARWPFVLWMSLQAVLVISIAAATDLINHMTKFSQNPRFRLARGLSYGCISGILSAHSLLVAKSAVELILRTIADRDNQFIHWQSWMLVLGLVFLALSQLYYLHRGLKLVSTSVLYPLVFCIYNIIAILDGLIYFDQTELITPLHACLITLGTVILLSGVLALSWRLNDEQHPPAVGQSTLAPGLGLVEDTDGEEEEEELLLGSDIGDEEASRFPTQTSYNTFSPTQNGGIYEEPTPLAPKRKKSLAPSMKTNASQWTERAHIWDELEDRNSPELSQPGANRRRSTTLPVRSESASLLYTRRGTGGPLGISSTNASADQLAPVTPTPIRRAGFSRRRRKSTGFPGFTARKSSRRQSVGGIQDALGGIKRWWQRGTGGKGKGQAASASNSPRGASTPTWTPYRDNPEAEAGGSSAGNMPRQPLDESPVAKSKRKRPENKGDGAERRIGDDAEDESLI